MSVSSTTEPVVVAQEYRRVPFAWGQVLALYNAITFIMLGIDMALLHLGYRHFHFVAVAPIAYCALAGIISFFTAFSAPLRRYAWVLGVLALIVGGIGTVIHLEIAIQHLHGSTFREVLDRLIFDPRPPLAPAALAGTGLLLVLISIGEYWPIPWIINIVRRIPVVRDWFAVKAE
jgi:hypothetical protein